MSFIRTAGYHWRVDEVSWGNPGPQQDSIMKGYYVNTGVQGRPSVKFVEKSGVQVWRWPVVYALYRDDDLVYVGQGILGDRLKAHRGHPQMGRRFNEFTWFSPVDLEQSADEEEGLPIWRPHSKTPEMLDVVNVADSNIKFWLENLELLLINMAHPRFNSQEPNKRDSIKWLAQSTKAQL